MIFKKLKMESFQLIHNFSNYIFNFFGKANINIISMITYKEFLKLSLLADIETA